MKKMKQISIEIIHKCPNRCLHCSSNSDINCTLKIETAEVKKIIDSASKLNTEVLSISGGEPFLHDGLLEIVHYAKSKGIKVYIYTSGIILTPALSANFTILSISSRFILVGTKWISVQIPIFWALLILSNTNFWYPDVPINLSYIASFIAGKSKIILSTATLYNCCNISFWILSTRPAMFNKVSFLGLVPHGRAANNTEELVLDADENEKLKLKLEAINNKK